MRILNIAETIQGGIASYLNDLSPALVKSYGPENLIYAVPVSQMPELTVHDDCTIEAMPPRQRSVKNLISFGLRTFRIIRKHKPEVIHVHSTVAGLLVRLAVPFARLSLSKDKRGIRPKVIYTPHGWSFVMDIPAWKRRAYALMERALAHLTNSIVLVTESEKTAAADAGFGTAALAKCHVIETGIPDMAIPPAHPVETTEGQKWQTAGHRINLLFAGRLDKQKGFEVLLDAMEMLDRDDICLHVFGEAVAEGGETKVFEPQAEPGKPTILYYGWQQRDRLLSFLPDCDAVVMPSRWEGLPIMALEACRASVPLISSDIPVLQDVVNHMDGGICCPTDDPTALAAALERVGDETWTERRVRARQTYEQRFTFHNMSAALLRLYEGENEGTGSVSTDEPSALI